jgi:AraC family transcriptional regulator of adaptative response/methylated-DNA-[protein]-cysteine methyltransferase
MKTLSPLVEDVVPVIRDPIHFAFGECSLGSVLVAMSQKGIRAITLGDDPDELGADFQHHFPEAQFLGEELKFQETIAKVVGFIDHPATGLDLPLDVRGSAFQHRVWQALGEIPAGSTVTYTDVAERIGSPGAVRAVASACAANKIAVAIPCHRVLRSDGSLTGYRWGAKRKRALLEKEATA